MVVIVELYCRLAGVTTYTTAIHEFTFAVVVWEFDYDALSRLDFDEPNDSLCYVYHIHRLKLIVAV
jgi:hypothetical protein